MVRERFGMLTSLVPGFFIAEVGKLFNSDTVSRVGIFLMFLGCIFSFKIYEILFVDSNSPCALYAGNLALQFGFSPKAQNGELWNLREHKVSEIYRMYPNDRQRIPREGSAGFMFYTSRKGTFSRRVEFYDYRAGGDTIVYYQFYFHPFDNNGDETCREKMSVKKIKKNLRFIALERM